MEQAKKTIAIENWNDIRELVLMSIGTDKGSWWADPNLGSDLRLLRQIGKIDGQTAGTLRRMILESLQWLVEDGLLERIECEAERSGKNEISYCVKLSRGDGSGMDIKGAWNGV